VGGFAAVLTDRVQRWQAGGRMAHVADRRLFLREHEGGQPLLLFLHGFPSSSYDWRGVLELLPGHATLAFDFLGFGLSEKPREHLYSLMWQADATEALVAAAAPESVFVVAHDMGTSVATELMARDLRGELEMRIAGILLFNGSILLDRASPTIGQRLLRSPLGPLFAGSPPRRRSVASSRASSRAITRSAARRPRTSGRCWPTPPATASPTASSTTWTSASA
jgi:pimeloyl-ACP methyl ester carboxylesterase